MKNVIKVAATMFLSGLAYLFGAGIGARVVYDGWNAIDEYKELKEEKIRQEAAQHCEN